MTGSSHDAAMHTILIALVIGLTLFALLALIAIAVLLGFDPTGRK